MNIAYRAGAIGRTGRGNYGHNLEMAYQGLPDVSLVAVADPDPEGLRAAGERTGAQRLYADYQEMLDKEELDLVSVCPRWPDCHVEMVTACAEAGVKGVLSEKPIARTLAEADAMIEACERNGVRLAVAYRRANPHEQHAKRLVDDGAIGQVQVMRGHGKADHRSGALDTMVLGGHIFDSMRYFAGSDVAWAHGHVTQDGREVTLEDIREGNEEVGLLAGNGVAAYYVFNNGMTAHFESHPGHDSGDRNVPWMGLEIYGNEGMLSLRDTPNGGVYIYPHDLWMPDGSDGGWERVLLEKGQALDSGRVNSLVNQTIVKELIQAIQEDREVVACPSGRDGRAALEMIMAVHESQRLGTRVSFPLENRENPYEIWRRERR